MLGKLNTYGNLLIVGLLFNSGCATDSGPSTHSSSRKAQVTPSSTYQATPATTRIQSRFIPELSKILDSYSPVVPIDSREVYSWKRSLGRALSLDIQSIARGSGTSGELGVLLKQVIDRYESASLRAVEDFEAESKSAIAVNPIPREQYESMVNAWMDISNLNSRIDAFGAWVDGVLQAFTMDLQLAGDKIAVNNLEAEVVDYLN
jgi:hypothetical protein